MDFKPQKDIMAKTAYAAVGAPIVVARKVKNLGNKFMSDAQTQFNAYADEGEKAAKQLKDRNVVEELEHRMNIDKVQDRVEQLRDQLETTLNNWRESFTPAAETATAKKAPAKKAPAGKTTSKKGPAKTIAKKTVAKKTVAKKATAKAAASK